MAICEVHLIVGLIRPLWLVGYTVLHTDDHYRAMLCLLGLAKRVRAKMLLASSAEIYGGLPSACLFCAVSFEDVAVYQKWTFWVEAFESKTIRDRQTDAIENITMLYLWVV